MNKKKKKAKLAKLRWLYGDLIKFEVKLPIFIFLFILLLPFIAYGDLILFGHRNFLGYVSVSGLELLLVYIGFSLANSKATIVKND